METILKLIDIAFKAIGAFFCGVLFLAIIAKILQPKIPKSPTKGLVYGEKKRKPLLVRIRKMLK